MIPFAYWMRKSCHRCARYTVVHSVSTHPCGRSWPPFSPPPYRASEGVRADAARLAVIATPLANGLGLLIAFERVVRSRKSVSQEGETTTNNQPNVCLRFAQRDRRRSRGPMRTVPSA